MSQSIEAIRCNNSAIWWLTANQTGKPCCRSAAYEESVRDFWTLRELITTTTTTTTTTTRVAFWNPPSGFKNLFSTGFEPQNLPYACVWTSFFRVSTCGTMGSWILDVLKASSMHWQHLQHQKPLAVKKLCACAHLHACCRAFLQKVAKNRRRRFIVTRYKCVVSLISWSTLCCFHYSTVRHSL